MKNLATFVCWIQLLLLIPYIDCYKAYKRRLSYLSKCKADAKEPWTYRGDNGPKFWGETYPNCNGWEQSPIAISTHHLISDPQLGKLSFDNYNIPVTKARIENNGHTVEVTPTDGVERTIFVDGATYRLIQLHFHWGDAYYRGAEHIIDGFQYAMEMHLVHRNANEEVAVVGVFFQEQSQTTEELQNIIREFPKVMYKGTRSELSQLNLNKLLPANPSSFFRYHGSLTTPSCDEGVTWSILPKPLPVGLFQMAEFRKLFSATKSEAALTCRLSNNYRPIQPLNDRDVFVSQ